MMLSAAPAAPVEINIPPALKPAVVSDIDVSVRLIGGRGAVLMPGRDINLTFQTSSDAYVIIYNIDSEGYVHLLFPADGRPQMVQGKKVYFLPEQGAGVTWKVGRDTGIEYIHAIAVGDPSRIDRDELYYLAQNSTMPEDRRLRIDMDPFLAFNMIDEELIDEAERMIPATDYTYFFVNHKVDYPGYLCYKCHSPSKIPDPYAMECPEVDIEMMAVNEDAGYPYPQLFAVLQAGSGPPEDEYSSYTYYADNLSLGYEDYDYDDQKVYLSVYNTYGYYPYSCYWPGYWSWYVNSSPYWYWDISWGIGWGWSSGCYYYHYPFYSWYPYSYSAYWSGYNHGYWDGWYGNGYYSGYYYPANERSLYAGRGFTRRGALDYTSTRVKTAASSSGRNLASRGSLDYNATRVKTSRETTLASSQLVRERTAAATARSYQRSRLAKQVTRERASTGFRSFEANRYGTGTSSRYERGVYGNYGATRSARTANQDSRRTKERVDAGKRTLRSENGARSYERGSSKAAVQRGTGRQNVGSDLEKRVRERSSARETRTGTTGKARSYTPQRKSPARSGTSARSTRDPEKSDKGNTGKSGTSRTQPRQSEVKSNPSSSGSSGKSTTRSAPPARSSSGRSSSRSSGKSSSGSSGRKR